MGAEPTSRQHRIHEDRSGVGSGAAEHDETDEQSPRAHQNGFPTEK